MPHGYEISVPQLGTEPASRENSTAYDLNLQGSGTLPSGYYKLQSANEDLKWESSSQLNFGTDFSLFGGDLYGSYDVFFKETKDMLVQPAFLGAIGFGGQTWINGPTLKNWGMELTLGYRHQTAYGLSYNITANADFYRSKVTYLPEKSKNSYEHNDYHNLAQDERAYGSRIGYVVEGLYQSREEVLAHGQAGARVGGLKYADLNGDGRINEMDRTWVFNPVPNFSYGINIDLAYRDFDFTMFWQGVSVLTSSTTRNSRPTSGASPMPVRIRASASLTPGLQPTAALQFLPSPHRMVPTRVVCHLTSWKMDHI